MQDNGFNGIIIGKKKAQLLFVGDIIVCKKIQKNPQSNHLEWKYWRRLLEIRSTYKNDYNVGFYLPVIRK